MFGHTAQEAAHRAVKIRLFEQKGVMAFICFNLDE